MRDVLRFLLIIILCNIFHSTIALGTMRIYNVDEYGINPDGKPIAAKLSKLSREVSSSGGGTILFGKGRYIMGSELTSDGKPIGNVRLYPNVTYQGVEGTVIVPNDKKLGFHSMFCTIDHSAENIVFENIIFETYIGTRNNRLNDFRLAIILHWCKNILIRDCRFIFDIGSIDTRYSHDINDKNSGIYRVNGLVIENCVFEAKILVDSGYKDITSVGICAQNVFFRNNRFLVSENILANDNKFFPNCCLEVQGKDIWVYNNTFSGLTNAIDFTSTDNYPEQRNINIFNNIIKCYRGLALWSNGSNIARGVSIQNNYFNLSCDNSNKRVTGIKGCVVFVTHPTDSYKGIYKDVFILGNIFDYENTKDYYAAITYEDWIDNIQHKSDEKYGMAFEEFYSALALGGASIERSNIYICNNAFRNCVFPCVYIGGGGISKNYYVCENVFDNCVLQENWAMVSLVNFCTSIYITGNRIRFLSSENNVQNGLFCQTKLNNKLYSRGIKENSPVFNGISIRDNRAINFNTLHAIRNDVPFLQEGESNCFESVVTE